MKASAMLGGMDMMRTVAAKMAALTLTALLGLATVTAVNHFQTERVYDGANFGNVNAAPSLVVLDEMRRSFLQLAVHLSRHVHSYAGESTQESERQLKAGRQAVFDAINKYDIDGCLGTNCYADNTDKAFLEKEKVVWAKYDSIVDDILKAARGGKAEEATARSLMLEADPLANELHELITKHIAYNVDVARDFTAKAVVVKSDALYITLGIGAAMVLLIGGMGFGTARSIIRQLGGDPEVAAGVAARFATGDLTERIELRPGDTDSVMARIKTMIAAMERLASRAEAIGKGDLEQEVQLSSEHDRLGKALNEMIRLLRAGKLEDERRNWLKDGYAQLSSSLSGDLSSEQLADSAVAMIGRYLGAGRGVFYRYVEASEQLELIGSYMYTERNRIGARYALGEGAVGQVARERKPIILAVADDGPAPIVTGTVQQTPRYTYTYPLVHEKELVGVLELASMVGFDERRVEFLNNVTTLLSSLLFVADQRAHIRKLLLASEAGEKEMRAQSEQLRAANDQMLEQQRQLQQRTEQLQENNARMEEQQQQLQQQTEELQQSNAQMEEQQQQLQQQAEEMQQTNAQMEEQQQQLQQQNADLQESRRLQEIRTQQLDQASKYKSEFLSNMSHELRTPLNSIILLSKMMCSDDSVGVSGEAHKWAQVIHRSGQDLLRLINDVLDLSKVEAGRMDVHLAPVASAQVCADLQGMFEHMARDKGLSLTVTDQLQGDFVSDWDKLSQVLRNLLANAVKFTREGGVSFTINRRPGAALPLCLSVRDTGIGIAVDKRAVIFEAFQQADGSTSREFGGTGLGLTISQRFVQMLGGVIELNSEPGQGSEFMVLLPEVAAGAGAEALPVSAPAPAVAPQADDRAQLGPDDLVILLVDDDEAFCLSVLTMNRRLGYKTVLARTGAEGLTLAARHKPRGILLDLSLPDMDGSEVLHQLKSRPELAPIPVHIVSSRDRDDALLLQGAIGFLQKPANDMLLERAEVALLGAVARVAAGGSGILVIENGGITGAEVGAIIGSGHGPVQAAAPGPALDALLQQQRWPLAVIDLGRAPLQSSLDLAARLRDANPGIALVFYAIDNPGDVDSAALRRWSECVIVKTGQADRRLLENVERFLRAVPQQRSTPAAKIASGRDGKPLNGKHILVVDDDPRNLFVMTAALERHGAKISNAVNGRRALDLLREQRVDLILMDIMMPEMDGMQAIAALRADSTLSSIPVVAISAKASPADMADILASGADDYLSKPVDYDVLVAKAVKWCGGRVS
ncbi:response regulator [Rugamonas aquatica]|uniref:Virulence sensor protein BvgS n=1 Tax=Rugamonas aquatica TaxID=2743357 RepID=A0A6A7MVE0_9BURK|nr:response regulator [Rugamonas aquatica]MQA37092.1 response regulator [Rugamonas aquatica]